MAKVKKNLLTQGLSGAVGNMVFRTQGEKTSVYILTPRKTGLSNEQKEANNEYKLAVANAKQSINNPQERIKFEQMAKKERKRNAYQAAISFYLKK
jgi:hypothetical protein